MHDGRKAGAVVPGGVAIIADRVRQLWREARHGARMMIGIPDYDNYVAHYRQRHPDRSPMSREAFFRDRLNARYAGIGKRGGCC
ncbi:MAG: CstA-like transporter-associated (seleno)protein [Rhodospirillales bacterium]